MTSKLTEKAFDDLMDSLTNSAKKVGRVDAYKEAIEIAENLFTDKTRRNVGREMAAAIRKKAKEVK